MATAVLGTETVLIGEMAGKVWHYLAETGSVTVTKLITDLDAPRDQVMQAIGWLAREEKIGIDHSSRSKRIYLL